MKLLAIDPGTTESAFVELDGDELRDWGKVPNETLAVRLRGRNTSLVVCEMVASYGAPVGKEVFETCLWIGRFAECAETAGYQFNRLYRVDVKMHLCHTMKGVNDSVIRQALIDRYGPGKDKAIGTKKKPGPLYELKGDEWQALALAVTFMDQRLKQSA